MHHFLDGFIDQIERLFVCADIGMDEGRRRVLLALCIVVSVPVICLFAIEDFSQGSSIEGTLILLTALVFLVSLVFLRYIQNIVWIFRISALVALVLLSFEFYIGGGDGHAFLWLYFYPIAVFYMFGKKEGVFWVVCSLVIAALFLPLGLGRIEYPMGVTIRFLVTYSIVILLSYALESARDRYYNHLLQEKTVLEEAFQQIKTLKGLIPICASCKKIRDDQGYWKEIESYIRKHSEAEFSHSICPECYKQYGLEDDLEELV
jgi:hypothetical protein